MVHDFTDVEIWGSHFGDYEEYWYNLLEFSAMQSGRHLLYFLFACLTL
jgi:hypothetical protein